jgi:hypothetical protein
MDLSIVIVSWNTRKLLEECLASIQSNPPVGEYEVWVVDNASTDGTSSSIQQNYPQVKLINNTNNIGFANANNLAISQCTNRFILVLNPDTVIKPDALPTLIRYLDEHPRSGAVGPRVLNPDGTLQTSCYPAPTLARQLWKLLHLDSLHAFGEYDQTRWDQKRDRHVDVIQGACLLLRKEALDQVGLFDEDYFMYTEEVDLCYRLKKAGWELTWVPHAEVIHYGGQSTQQVAPEMFINLYQSKILYFRKNHGRAVSLMYKLILFVVSLIRVLLTPLTWLEGPSRREQHLKLSTNYRRLLLELPGL